MDTEAPVASILILAYNNQDYVFDAIRGVLSQRCKYTFEILIGEDCSTDSTREQIALALSESSGRVSVIYRQPNLGMHRNYDDLLRRARGRYVADLDGDDSWTDTSKLERQIDFLEANPHVSMVFTRSQPVDANGVALHGDVPYLADRQSLSFAQVFSRCDIPHSTVVFRRALLLNLPGWTFDLPNYDWSMFIALAAQGEVRGLNDITSTYTWHGHGSASGRSPWQHAVANYRHFLAHAKHFRQQLDKSTKMAARTAFENTVVWVLAQKPAMPTRVALVRMYLRLCWSLGIAPNARWLLAKFALKATD